MRAVRLFAPGDVRCVEVDQPALEREDEVLIKVSACGVCGSDIIRVMEKGTYAYPITIGHEFAGEVREVGREIDNFIPGDRVTVVPLVPCGKCNYCQIGKYVLCANYKYYGTRIDGAMAEYIKVHGSNVLKLPDGVEYESGAMTDPVSVALHAVRKAEIEPGCTAIVFGMGPIGFLAMQWLKALGCERVVVVDVFDEKLRLAAELGADYCLNGRKRDVTKAILEYTKGEGADAVIELAGNSISQVQAIQSARKMGTVVYCGISYDDLTIPNKELSRILRGELVLKGAWNSSVAPLPINEWKSALIFMKSGKIETIPLISHRFKLEECQDCFNMMYSRSEIFNKVLFEPGD